MTSDTKSGILLVWVRDLVDVSYTSDKHLFDRLAERSIIQDECIVFVTQPSNQQKDEILQLYKSGMKKINIAKRIGCAQSTVALIIDKYLVY